MGGSTITPDLRYGLVLASVAAGTATAYRLRVSRALVVASVRALVQWPPWR